MTPTQWHSWRRQKDMEAEREIIAMSTGHRIKISNVTKNKKTGEMEFNAPKKKKTLQQRYAAKKKTKWKPAR